MIAAAQWIATERARLTQRRGLTLRAASWATTVEIAEDRGAPLDLVDTFIQDALGRGLLALRDRGVVVTSAGHDHVLRAAAA